MPFCTHEDPVEDEHICRVCHKHLTRVDLSSTHYLLVCDNAKCQMFQQPQGGYKKKTGEYHP